MCQNISNSSFHFIKVREENVCTPAAAEEMFDVITYSKGSSIFRMLHDFIGDTVVQNEF